jgi:hypothetical protein
MKINIHRTVCFVLPMGLACLLACKDKVPYPEPVVTPGSALPEEEPLAPTPVGPRGAIPGAVDVTSEAEIGPVRPAALIGTPEVSFLVMAAPNGSDLKVRRTDGIVRLMADGDARILSIQSTPLKGRAGAKRPSAAVSVRLQGGGRNETILQAAYERPDLVALGAADPDLAAEYYHVETIMPVGVHGDHATFLAGVSAYLGGAHPHTTMTLRTVDVRDGRLVPPDVSNASGSSGPPFPGVGGDPCLSRPAGVARVEGTGGTPLLIAGFSHEYEVCSGDFRLVAADQPPEPAVSDAVGPSAFLRDGALQMREGGRRFPGVVDWRASADGRRVVMLAGQGRGDRIVQPWDGRRLRDMANRSREIRYWAEGMPEPAVLGRASRLLFVQFPGESDDSSSLIRAFDDR